MQDQGIAPAQQGAKGGPAVPGGLGTDAMLEAVAVSWLAAPARLAASARLAAAAAGHSNAGFRHPPPPGLGRGQKREGEVPLAGRQCQFGRGAQDAHGSPDLRLAAEPFGIALRREGGSAGIGVAQGCGQAGELRGDAAFQGSGMGANGTPGLTPFPSHHTIGLLHGDSMWNEMGRGKGRFKRVATRSRIEACRGDCRKAAWLSGASVSAARQEQCPLCAKLRHSRRQSGAP